MTRARAATKFQVNNSHKCVRKPKGKTDKNRGENNCENGFSRLGALQVTCTLARHAVFGFFAVRKHTCSTPHDSARFKHTSAGRERVIEINAKPIKCNSDSQSILNLQSVCACVLAIRFDCASREKS